MLRFTMLSLLLLLLLAPACAPEKVAETPVKKEPLVLLTDTLLWQPEALAAYRDSLETEGYRVLVSGYPDETATSLSGRLPWLLQPGVALFIYDVRLAGPAAYDTLVNQLARLQHPALIKRFE